MNTVTLLKNTTALSPVSSPIQAIHSIHVNGVVRHYTLIEPDATAPDPLPLVFAFHGGGGNTTKMMNALGFDNSLSPRPYLTVLPQGFDVFGKFGTPPTRGVWNSGQSYMAYQNPQDDVAFIDALLLEATQWAANAGWRIDQSRTYATGFSNGGMMVYRLAAERSKEFAAMAVMQASIGGDPDPSDPKLPFHVNHPADHGAEPVSILQIHGLLDPSLPFAEGSVRSGSNPRSDLPVQDAVDIWVNHNNCDLRPTIEFHPKGLMRTWSGGNNGTEVKLLTMPSVAHEVPNGIMQLIEPFLLSHRK